MHSTFHGSLTDANHNWNVVVNFANLISSIYEDVGAIFLKEWTRMYMFKPIQVKSFGVKMVIHTQMSLTPLNFHLSYFGAYVNKIKKKRRI